MVATLYKQDKEIDIPELESQNSLSERSFSSRNFLIQNQNVLTPGAFAFSQGWLRLIHFCHQHRTIDSLGAAFKIFSVKWDRSVQSTFHKRLQMPEPVYQYDQKDVFPIQVQSAVISS